MRGAFRAFPKFLKEADPPINEEIPLEILEYGKFTTHNRKITARVLNVTDDGRIWTKGAPGDDKFRIFGTNMLDEHGAMDEILSLADAPKTLALFEAALQKMAKKVGGLR